MSKKEKKAISNHLDKNLEYLKTSLGNSTDMVFRELVIGEKLNHKIAVVYVDGLINRDAIQNFILKLLTVDIRIIDVNLDQGIIKNISDVLFDTLMPEGQTKKVENMDEVFSGILSGDTVLFMNGVSEALVISTRGWSMRGISEPSTEIVVQGPKEAFNETLRTNTALIRRRIKNPSLWIESKVIGTQTKTDIAIVYIKSLVNEETLKELHTRLDHIDIDGIIDSSYVQQLITDSPHSVFPTIRMTERPDVVAGNLLEGRIAVIVDGSPFVLILPISLISLFQSSEDYYINYQVASFNRILRFIAVLFSIYTPAIYIALTNYNPELIPQQLMLAIIAQRSNVPFSSIMEVLFLMFFFEIIYEAGIRMPSIVGSSVTIVGAIVIGDAAVQAGFVSTISIIVIAIAAVTNFVIPSYILTNSFRNIRFLMFFVAALFGFLGIVISTFLLFVHFCGLRSFGVPYLSPIIPMSIKNQQDVFVRMPLWQFNKRPISLHTKKQKRDKNNIRHEPR